MLGFPNSTVLTVKPFHRTFATMVRTDDPEVVWDKPNEVDDKWIQFIDDNVLASKLSPCIPRMRVLCVLIEFRAPRR